MAPPRKFRIALSRPEPLAPIFWLCGRGGSLKLISDVRRASWYKLALVGEVVNDLRKVTKGYVITVH